MRIKPRVPRMYHFVAILLGVFSFLLFQSSLHAQVDRGGIPYSFTANLLEPVPTLTMPVPDIDRLRAEDQINDQLNVPYRFAYPHAVDIDIKNTGTWTSLPNGDRIWRLQITCPGALNTNFLYSDFYLPEGALLYLYSPDQQEVLGAFGAHNNRDHREFATSIIHHESTILEYYEPAQVAGQGSIVIRQVAHGYRGFGDENNEGLNDAGSCQVNVNCSPEGDNWQIQKKSVGRITINGNALCTGALINNALQNCEPYFLTANHCITGSFDAINNPNASSYVFYWNFERPGCANTGTPPNETTSGAVVVANSFASGSAATASDFALLRLNSDPGEDYDVYYAGYDASGVSGNTGAGIHHPAGDAKKIATHDIIPQSVVNDHYWRIFWSQTPNGFSVTEGGSSGSPLFNNDKRIIGQLFGGFQGGQPNCSDPANDEGDYGKLSWSWDNDGATDARRRLRDWLDPVGLGTTTIVNGRGVCGLNCAITSSGLANISCNDNGTPDDASDDFITFTLNPIGADISPAGYQVSGPGFTSVSASYGSASSFSTQNGTAGDGNLSLTITDLSSPNCQFNVTVSDPGSCAINGCEILSVTVSNIICNDNGTPNNDTDDYVQFTLNVTAQGADNLYYVRGPLTGNNRGNYGVNRNFRTQSGTAGGGDIALVIEDRGDVNCTFDFILPDPGVCSNNTPVCSLQSTGLSNISCNDNATPMDPSDDFINFSLNPSGTNTGANYVVSGDFVTNQIGVYGEVTVFSTLPGTADDPQVLFTIEDVSDSQCQLTGSINGTGTCSDVDPGGDCVILSAGASAASCNDNGTSSDPLDDFITFSLNPSATDASAGYTVSANGNSIGSGVYGSSTGFQIFPIDPNIPNYTIVLTDDNDPGCQFSFALSNPGTCSDDPVPSDCDLSGVSCQDYTLALGSNGRASVLVSDLIVVDDPDCAYSVKLVSPFRNRFTCVNLGTSTITVRITDTNGNSTLCNLTLTVTDPTGACGDSGESWGNHQVDLQSDLRIFPNPSKGVFTFDAFAQAGEAANAQLLDRFGRVVWAAKWQALPAGAISVDTDVPAGIYLFRLSGKAGDEMKKVMIID